MKYFKSKIILASMIISAMLFGTVLRTHAAEYKVLHIHVYEKTFGGIVASFSGNSHPYIDYYDVGDNGQLIPHYASCTPEIQRHKYYYRCACGAIKEDSEFYVIEEIHHACGRTIIYNK